MHLTVTNNYRQCLPRGGSECIAFPHMYLIYNLMFYFIQDLPLYRCIVLTTHCNLYAHTQPIRMTLFGLLVPHSVPAMFSQIANFPIEVVAAEGYSLEDEDELRVI